MCVCVCVCVVDGGSAWRVLLSQGGAAWLEVGVAKKREVIVGSEFCVLRMCFRKKNLFSLATHAGMKGGVVGSFSGR